MDWFGTTIQENKSIKNKVLEFPSHVLELWECKKCLNVIYKKKSNYSPFDSQHQINSTFNLQNVVIKFTHSIQYLSLLYRFKNKKQHLNQIHVYCKTCQEQNLLAQLIPENDPLKNQLSYRLTPQAENIQRTQIIMGRTNFKKLAQPQSMINPEENEFGSSISSRLNKIKNEIQNQIMLWYQSKNFRIYEAYVVHSEKKKKDLDYLKNFLIQMNPNLNRKELNFKKILKNRQRISNSLGTEESVSYGHQ